MHAERAVSGVIRVLFIAVVAGVALNLFAAPGGLGDLDKKNNHVDGVVRVMAQGRGNNGSNSNSNSSSSSSSGPQNEKCKSVLDDLIQCLPYFVEKNGSSGGGSSKNQSAGCCNPFISILKSPQENRTQCLCNLTDLGTSNNKPNVDANRTMSVLLNLCNSTTGDVPSNVSACFGNMSRYDNMLVSLSCCVCLLCFPRNIVL